MWADSPAYPYLIGIPPSPNPTHKGEKFSGLGHDLGAFDVCLERGMAGFRGGETKEDESGDGQVA